MHDSNMQRQTREIKSSHLWFKNGIKINFSPQLIWIVIHLYRFLTILRFDKYSWRESVAISCMWSRKLKIYRQKCNNKFHFYEKSSVIKHLWDTILALKSESRDEILKNCCPPPTYKTCWAKNGRTVALLLLSNRISVISTEHFPMGHMGGSFVLLC